MVVLVGGIIVRVGGGEARWGGRGIDVDAAFFMSIFWWKEVLFVWVSAEWDSSKIRGKRVDQLFNPNFVGRAEFN